MDVHQLPDAVPESGVNGGPRGAVVKGTGIVRRCGAGDNGLSIPISELVGFTLVAILAGLGAAIIPARRASRLNVLDALHYE